MGFRFRKSIKIAPGMRMNFGKKSFGVSIGGKYGGVSVNSKSGASARVSAPGTGLSYHFKPTKKQGGKRKTASNRVEKIVPKKPVFLRWWYILIAVLLFIGGVTGYSYGVGTVIFGIVVGIAMLVPTICVGVHLRRK